MLDARTYTRRIKCNKKIELDILLEVDRISKDDANSQNTVLY